MKRNWMWSLFLALLLGVTLGIVLSAWFNRPGMPKSSSLLREFSFVAVAAKVGNTNWQAESGRVTVIVSLIEGP